MTEPILSVQDLVKHYPIRQGVFRRQVGSIKAVDGVSFDLMPGETLGLSSANRAAASRPWPAPCSV